MEIKVQVEMYDGGSRSTVEVILTDIDLKTLAENKVLFDYACESCSAKEIEVLIRS